MKYVVSGALIASLLVAGSGPAIAESVNGQGGGQNSPPAAGGNGGGTSTGTSNETGNNDRRIYVTTQTCQVMQVTAEGSNADACIGIVSQSPKA